MDIIYDVEKEAKDFLFHAYSHGYDYETISDISQAERKALGHLGCKLFTTQLFYPVR